MLHIRSGLRPQVSPENWGNSRSDDWFASDDDLSVPFPSPEVPTTSPSFTDSNDDLLQSLRRNPFWTLTDRPGLDLMALRGSNMIRSIPQVSKDDSVHDLDY